MDHAVQEARVTLARAGYDDEWTRRMRRALDLRPLARWLKKAAKRDYHGTVQPGGMREMERLLGLPRRSIMAVYLSHGHSVVQTITLSWCGAGASEFKTSVNRMDSLRYPIHNAAVAVIQLKMSARAAFRRTKR